MKTFIKPLAAVAAAAALVNLAVLDLLEARRPRLPHAVYGASSTISGLTAYGTQHGDDLYIVVDVHDTTMASTGTDKKATTYQVFGSPSNNQLLGWSGSSTGTPVGVTVGSGLSLSGGTLSATGGGSGTVTSVGLTVPSGLTVTGSPVTTSGTLAIGGTLGVSAGGTGTSATPANGQIHIGNGSGFALGTLTAGANVTITNSAGGITIASSGGSAGAGGSSGQVQWNNGGSLAGMANLTVSSNSLANLTSVSDPGTAAAGDLWLSSTSGGLSFAPSSGWPGRIPRRIYFGTGFAAVTNTSSYASMLSTPSSSDGSLAIPANALKVGTCIELYPNWLWSTAATGPTVNYRVQLGGTTVLSTFNTSTLAGSQANQTGFTLGPIRLYVTATGASGGIVGNGYLTNLGTGGTTSNQLCSQASGGGSPVTINTTVSNTLDFQVQLGTASTSNTWTMQAIEVTVR